MRGIRDGWTKHPWEWLLLLAAVVLLATLIAAPRAHGGQAVPRSHGLKIEEVFPGITEDPDRAFVELQMPAAGQNHVNGMRVTLFNASGGQTHSSPLDQDVLNGENQRSVLIGDTNVAPELGITPDFVDSGLGGTFDGAGGAACFYDPDTFERLDCVAWGSFDNSTLMLAVGTPVVQATGFSSGLSIVRAISPGCPTLLDLPDDTNDSAADFTTAFPPAPRNNASTPTNLACAGSAAVKCGGLTATKTGTSGPDKILGTPRRDVIAGLGGKDVIRGLAGKDVLCGGAGRDKLIGGRGRDRLLGGAGRDLCRGGPRKDVARRCEVKRAI
jgi:RTX calcium-binding nonapeptide repeat (4 copies)